MIILPLFQSKRLLCNSTAPLRWRGCGHPSGRCGWLGRASTTDGSEGFNLWEETYIHLIEQNYTGDPNIAMASKSHNLQLTRDQYRQTPANKGWLNGINGAECLCIKTRGYSASERSLMMEATPCSMIDHASKWQSLENKLRAKRPKQMPFWR